MSKRSLAVVVLFAAVLMPAVVHAAGAPVPPDQLEAILAGGLPCTHACYVERDCGCDPPVIVSCTGCRTCNLTLFGVNCDGVVHSCPPCAQW